MFVVKRKSSYRLEDKAIPVYWAKKDIKDVSEWWISINLYGKKLDQSTTDTMILTWLFSEKVEFIRSKEFVESKFFEGLG